jgi:hypothetical protein
MRLQFVEGEDNESVLGMPIRFAARIGPIKASKRPGVRAVNSFV